MSNSITTNNSNLSKMSELTLSSGFTAIAFLLVLIYGVITLVMIVIYVKRVLRRRSLTIEFVHKQNQPAASGTEKLRVKINQFLDEVAQFVCEPTLLSADDIKPTEKNQLSDFYRMKTVDKMADVDEAFANFDVDLKRPMGKDVGQHFRDVKSHSSGCLKSIRTNQLLAISELYVNARYGAEPFTLQDYNRFQELTANIISVLRIHKTANSSETKLNTKDVNFDAKGDKIKSASTKSEPKVLYNVPESCSAKLQGDTDPLL